MSEREREKRERITETESRGPLLCMDSRPLNRGPLQHNQRSPLSVSDFLFHTIHLHFAWIPHSVSLTPSFSLPLPHFHPSSPSFRLTFSLCLPPPLSSSSLSCALVACSLPPSLPPFLPLPPSVGQSVLPSLPPSLPLSLPQFCRCTGSQMYQVLKCQCEFAEKEDIGVAL